MRSERSSIRMKWTTIITVIVVGCIMLSWPSQLRSSTAFLWSPDDTDLLSTSNIAIALATLAVVICTFIFWQVNKLHKMLQESRREPPEIVRMLEKYFVRNNGQKKNNSNQRDEQSVTRTEFETVKRDLEFLNKEFKALKGSINKPVATSASNLGKAVNQTATRPSASGHNISAAVNQTTPPTGLELGNSEQCYTVDDRPVPTVQPHEIEPQNASQTPSTTTTNVYYSSVPEDDGSFKELKDRLDWDTIYSLTLDGPSESATSATIDLCASTDRMRTALQAPNQYLAPVCSYDSNPRSASFIIVESKGKADLVGQRWRIREGAKLRIRFQ